MWSSNSRIIDAKLAQRTQELHEGGRSASLSTEDSIYLRATATEIVSHIEKGRWTASYVLEAYIKRAVYAHEQTNCLTEVFFPRARKQAAELDAEFILTKKLRGPLHGVPVSIKDQFKIEGVDNSIGFSQWLNKPAERNADIVNLLIAAGAIIYVKTNVPQTMFAFECSNPVFGRTTNPYNDGYTSGGSSGGEAALLAMDGSAIGIGSDIGGSLRIPAAYCGVYSLKPAGGRVSYIGACGPTPGFDGIVSVAGPMGRSVKDLEIVSRIIFGQGTDTSLPPIPFRDVEIPKRLKFGYYTSDKYIKASPACQRAVFETIERLREAGHECVQIEFPDAPHTAELFVGLTSADGYKTMLSHIGPDKRENALFLSTLGPRLPGPIRRLAAWLAERILGDEIFAGAMRMSHAITLTDYWKLLHEKRECIQRFHDEIWVKHDLDAIIAPVQAMPQLPHGGCDNFIALAASTFVYNLLDLPVGCIPVTRVDAQKDVVLDEWWGGSDHGSPMMENGLFKGDKPLYKPESLHGMPVSIQIVGKKWEEEKLLGVMGVVDGVLGERGFGPGAWEISKEAK
ncbi:amidase [Crepidotus variabilis]|uniref:amidase n=1 Tax=Crepidotus variabilis TaxID=179855 RepID=A0A9P6EJT6_9AGAR|nr:amidase [Crepidotus variabilis]